MAATPPAVELPNLENAVEVQFGLSGNFTPLVSERDQNFQLATIGGDEYLVKVISLVEPAIVSEFQVAALLHLEQSDVAVPKVIRTRDGLTSGVVSAIDKDHRLRVVSYLPGVQLASVSVDRDMAFEFGARLARLDIALRRFSHPGDQPVLLWDMQRADELRGLLKHIDDADIRLAVERVLNDFRDAVLPRLGELRTQVIHGDANPGNVLIDPASRRIAGFIDFGDMVRAPLVFDIAIAAAYLRGNDSDPLSLIVPFIAGYGSVSVLQEAERVMLFDLVRARLATTITLLFWRLSARQKDDPYRQKTLRDEADAVRFLGALNSIGIDGFQGQIAGAA